MTARILDGKSIAGEIEAELIEEVADFVENNGVTPCLAAILVGEDAASQIYVKNKRLACERVGIDSRLHRLPAQTHESELLDLVAQLNGDEEVHGILVQLPLPAQIRASKILDAVHPLKDVDCFHPENVGLLSQGRPRFIPCTPHGCLHILHRSGIEVAGKHAVVVGRSDIVGRPMATLLSSKESPLGKQNANATVTIAHSRTSDLASITRQAEILIAAIGSPKLIKAEMVRPGATVIDVGMNRSEAGLCGDVDFAAVKEVAGAITPVPGGVGPLTITMLLNNTLAAARWQER